ncbi:uncharacterized protein BKCO1_37000125 [Diplodia corticola]|uniref:Uncharacterized protein n=1 Tax=Diplodia corticola TaxID=236234 RepID=A0A1J9RXQ2_9PEZI|nr:uncharacterized protein BKCO1_37000125 [Diplodia corticola]OJD32612.1 hypothetical protein BKCO1_37000125 [Diplodia corticola]
MSLRQAPQRGMLSGLGGSSKVPRQPASSHQPRHQPQNQGLHHTAKEVHQDHPTTGASKPKQMNNPVAGAAGEAHRHNAPATKEHHVQDLHLHGEGRHHQPHSQSNAAGHESNKLPHNQQFPASNIHGTNVPRSQQSSSQQAKTDDFSKKPEPSKTGAFSKKPEPSKTGDFSKKSKPSKTHDLPKKPKPSKTHDLPKMPKPSKPDAFSNKPKPSKTSKTEMLKRAQSFSDKAAKIMENATGLITNGETVGSVVKSLFSNRPLRRGDKVKFLKNTGGHNGDLGPFRIRAEKENNLYDVEDMDGELVRENVSGNDLKKC